MGDERLIGDSPYNNSNANEGSERSNRSAPFTLYTQTLEKHFPYYLAIGMTYDQYWNDDCTLVKFYREADKIRQARQNQMMWLQGMYIYDAIGRLVPALNPAIKKGTKVKPYMEKPYAISQDDVNREKEETERKATAGAKQYMEMFSSRYNKRFEEGKEVANGDHNRSS